MIALDRAPATPATPEPSLRLNRSLKNRLFLFHCNRSKDLRTELAQTAIVRLVKGGPVSGLSTSPEDKQ